ncbi:MAG: type III-B CRISPR module RAMP protein Cmr1 [Methylococcaceae bacterium]|nr:type III-B CRISPR module RAMP protein Cmr1 [Methylococcaceae bacterium]
MQISPFKNVGETINARFTLVTPMFLGGADQQAEGIRTPSVKGALRFWWRALNWGRYRAEAEEASNLSPAQRDIDALRILHSEEARLFGSSAKEVDGGQTGGQGVFLLAVKPESIHPIPADIRPFTGKAYLAGMGLSKRQALPADKEFEIILRFRPGTNSEDRESMRHVLRLFGLIGGLGSRSRRGFGSLTHLVSTSGQWRLPTDDEFEQEKLWLKAAIDVASLGSAPFSAIANDVEWFQGNVYPSADQALEDMGAIFSQYRTSGTATIPGSPTAPAGYRYITRGRTAATGTLNFYTSDHYHVHAIASAYNVQSPHNIPPKRSIFGLPHPYHFSSLNGRNVTFDFVPSWGQEHGKGRRASPLLMHIAAFTHNGQRKFQPLLLLMPAAFLPTNEQVQVSVGNTHVGAISPPRNYRVIHDFLVSQFTAI